MVEKSGGDGASSKVVGMIYPSLFVDWLIYMGEFNNYVDRILLFFDPRPPCVDSFYTLSVNKNRHFVTASSLILSTFLVIKRPLFQSG